MLSRDFQCSSYMNSPCTQCCLQAFIYVCLQDLRLYNMAFLSCVNMRYRQTARSHVRDKHAILLPVFSHTRCAGQGSVMQPWKPGGTVQGCSFGGVGL